MWRSIAILSFCLLGIGAAHAELVLDSGDRQNVLIELYTSEGCSSCPPAEAMLNAYRDDPELWTRYVPVAFHVDYWDYLGWKDAYAAPGHAVRQRDYARAGQTRAVYTPGFLVNGREWRPRFRTQRPEGSGETAGRLKLSIRAGKVDAEYRDSRQTEPEPLELHIAILGQDLHTRIRAGERTGTRARHEFVVLDHRKFSSRDGRWVFPLNRDALSAEGSYSLAAWVSRPGDLTPLQATGAYLPDSRP